MCVNSLGFLVVFLLMWTQTVLTRRVRNSWSFLLLGLSCSEAVLMNIFPPLQGGVITQRCMVHYFSASVLLFEVPTTYTAVSRAVRWGFLIRVVVRRGVSWRDHSGPQVAGSRLRIIRQAWRVRKHKSSLQKETVKRLSVGVLFCIELALFIFWYTCMS